MNDSENSESAAPIEPERSARGCSYAMRWGCLAAVLPILAVLALAVWQPWKLFASTCDKDESHLIDDEAGICYEIPEGWSAMDEAEREEVVEYNGFEVPSSGLNAGGDRFAVVQVHSLDAFFSDIEMEDDGEELVVAAEIVSVSTEAMFQGDHSIDSRTFTIGDYDAATATAEAPGSFGMEGGGSVMWARATVVDFGDEESAMWSLTIVPADEVDDEDGTVALLNQIHDSIDVQ